MGAMDNQVKKTVVLVDDHVVVRDGIRMIVEQQPEFEIVAEAGTNAETLTYVSSLKPDLVLLDMRLPDGDALDNIPRLVASSPETAILVLSVEAQIQQIKGCFEAGCLGYVSKSSGSQRILEGMAAVLRGEIYADGVVSEVLLNNVHPASPPLRASGDDQYASLSPREKEVLYHMAMGASTKEIALELGVSPKTVETHRQKLYSKLGMHDPMEIVRYAARIGIINPESWVHPEAVDASE